MDDTNEDLNALSLDSEEGPELPIWSYPRRLRPSKDLPMETEAS